MRSASSIVLVLLMLASTSAPVAMAGATELTLEGPAYVLAGDSGTFWGLHHVELGAKVPVPATRVQLFVDGMARGNDAAPAGSYEIVQTFPARGAYLLHAVAEPGRPTEARSGTLLVRAAVAPEGPSNVVARPVEGAPTARLSWDPPVDDGGAPIKQYRVFHSVDGGLWLERGVVGASQRFHDFPGLNLAHENRFAVEAVSQVATGPRVGVGVTGEPPAPPTVVATVIPDSDDVRVVVSAAGGVTQRIELERSANGGAHWARLDIRDGVALTRVDSPWFHWDTLYRATAHNLVGPSVPTVVGVTGDVPGQTRDVTVAVEGRVVVRWSPPADGGAVQGYVVSSQGVHIETNWSTREVVTTGAPGLTSWTVTARNHVGDGAPSAPAWLDVDATGPVEGLAALVIEELRTARVNLSWSPPLEDGGAPVVEYVIQRETVGSGGPSVTVATVDASTLAYSDAGLRDDSTYRYTVHSVNAVGPGAAASVEATVSDYMWRIVHVARSFRVCETGGACATVAPGGTYTRSGSGTLDVTGLYGGTITRKGVGMPGERALVTSWHGPDDESAESFVATTNATGEYDAPWGGFRWTARPSCETIPMHSRAGGQAVATSLTLCP